MTSPPSPLSFQERESDDKLPSPNRGAICRKYSPPYWGGVGGGVLIFLLILALPTFGQSTAIPDSLRKRIMAATAADTVVRVLTPKSDSTKQKPQYDWSKHSPKLAARKSLMVPGWGQVYNKQTWKVPVVYGAIVGVVIGFRWNNLRYQDLVEAYKSCYNLDTGVQTKTNADVYLRSQNLTRNLTIDQITKAKDFYRRNRDLNVIILAGVWVLNAVEANVTAHLLTFDTSEDISVRIKPQYEQNRYGKPIFGATLALNFKK